jgi:FeS assembly SUF system protein
MMESVMTNEELEKLDSDIVKVLRTCYDPEIPVDIFELGLIYGINISPDGGVVVRMTLTSPSCPIAGSLVEEVRTKVARVAGVKSVRVDLVWDPAWSPEMMSDVARLELGMM